MDKRLIVALDVATMDGLKALVGDLGEHVGYYKVGMELFYSVGTDAVRYLQEQGKSVFLDLKLHDIPNTVAQSGAVLTRLGVSMTNVHATGGFTMMRQMAETVKETAEKAGVAKPSLLAVTVLTSMGEDDWGQLGYKKSLADQVLLLAELAQKAGMDGVVASPQEAAKIRQVCGPEFLIVTPGVRPAGSAVNDQSRIATPAGALASGASHLVVGRPITAASSPNQAARDIIEEMKGVGK